MVRHRSKHKDVFGICRSGIESFPFQTTVLHLGQISQSCSADPEDMTTWTQGLLISHMITQCQAQLQVFRELRVVGIELVHLTYWGGPFQVDGQSVV